jgi:hypothetical protein
VDACCSCVDAAVSVQQHWHVCKGNQINGAASGVLEVCLVTLLSMRPGGSPGLDACPWAQHRLFILVLSIVIANLRLGSELHSHGRFIWAMLLIPRH